MATADERHKAVMSALSSMAGEIDSIKATLDKREYLDKQIAAHEMWINGNGKPGAKSQMNSLTLWNKAVIIVLIVNILSNWLL